MTRPISHTITLTPYRDHNVVGATVQIRNTGDGLSDAMNVAPIELELGTKVHVVLECTVEKHRYDPIADDPNALILVNMLKAGRATIVPKSLVTKALNTQEEAIAAAKPTDDPTLDLGAGEKPEDMTDEEWEASAGKTAAERIAEEPGE